MTSAEKNCVYCHSSMVGFAPQARYCSKKCYLDKIGAIVRSSIVPAICNNCNVEFMPKTRKVTKFCGPVCLYQSKAKAMADFYKGQRQNRSCEQCGNEFTPSRSFQVFCGPRCRNQATVMKRTLGLSAPEYRSTPIEAPVVLERRSVEDVARAKGEPVPEGMSFPFCDRCGRNQVSSIVESKCEKCIAELRKEAIDEQLK
jgi:hypothetical protein